MGLKVLCLALLHSSIKIQHATKSSSKPLTVMQTNAPFTNATVGVQNDDAHLTVSKSVAHYLQCTH